MVFGCISKNFLENIFWCLEKKKENTNSEKHKPQPRSSRPTTALSIAISPSSRDRDRRRDLAKRRRRSRSGVISPLRDRVDSDLDPVRSREGEIAISIRSRDPVRLRS